MNFFPALVVVCALTAACSQQPVEKTSAAPAHESQSENPIEQEAAATTRRLATVEDLRLAYVRKMFAFYPRMRYPLRSDVQAEHARGLMRTGKEIDTLLFGSYQTVYIAGTIADTSQYFGIFYFMPADDVVIALVTIDKQGRVIERTHLAQSCWQGGESDCNTYVQVTSDLKIEVNHSEYLFDGDEENGYASIPNEASGYTQISRITKQGRLKVLSKVAKDPQLLLQHPIIHDGD